MVKIDEKTAFIVTGGASGLGEAVVRQIVQKKGNVVIMDVTEESGKALEKELAPKVLFCKTDVTDEKSVQAAIDAGLKQFSVLNGVIACAGIGHPQRVLSSRGTVASLKDFNRVVQINLIGTFNVIRLASAVMAKQTPTKGGERGTIVTVASVAAFEGQIGQAAYSASKGGVVAMTLPIARELGALGIRINCIAPGIFKTPMMAGLPDKAQESLAKQVPFPPRLGDPTEFADCALNLVENQYYNGTVVRIDGSIRMAAM